MSICKLIGSHYGRPKRHYAARSVECCGDGSFSKLWARSLGQGRAFVREHGLPLERPRYWWDEVTSEAKLQDFHWHDLRHTFASRCVMAGVDLRTLPQLLGHKTLQMVIRYSHLSQSHELAAAERLCASVTASENPSDTRSDTAVEAVTGTIQ